MSAPARSQVPDLLKGFAMLGVIGCHALQRAIGNIASTHELWDWIYEWHMPLFFIVSGYLAAGSSRLGSPVYVRDKFFRLIYVFFIWRWLEWAFMRLPFSGLLPFNDYVPMDFMGNLKAFITSPLRPLWFLPEVFAFTMILCICKWLSFKKEWIANALLLAAVALSVVGYVFLLEKGSRYSYDIQFFGCFASGYLFSRLRLRDLKNGEGPWKNAFIYMAVFGAISMTVSMFFTSKKFVIFSTWSDAALWVGFIALAMYALTKLPFTTWLRKPLCYLGQHSMEYYTLQFLVLDLGWKIADNRLHFAVNLIGCLAVCTVVIAVIKKWLPWLDYVLWGGFPFPNKKKGAER